MKKHDEGYVMLLVVVVLLVLGIMSAALMSMTVTNLKNQRNSINRMQEKYAAQGELEKLVAQTEAQIAAKLSEDPDGIIEVEPSEVEDESGYAKAAVEKWLAEGLQLQNGAFGNESFLIGEPLISEDETKLSCVVSFSAQSESGDTRIFCELLLSGELKELVDEDSPSEGEQEDDETSVSPEFGNKVYKISFTGLQYTSYEISEGGGEG